MKTITSAVLGLALAVAGFAQTPAAAPAGKMDATPAPAKAKKVKKHSKKAAAATTAAKPVANSTPATK